MKSYSIDTPRLHLRALSSEDEALYCRIYSDPGVMRHLGVPLSAGEAAASFAVACRQQTAHASSEWWVALLRGSADGIGVLGTIRQGRIVEVGVMLLSRWQGNGYALEATTALIDRSFEEGAEVVRMTHSASNAAMAGLMRKLRFECKTMAGNWQWKTDRDRWRLAQAAASEHFAKAGSDR